MKQFICIFIFLLLGQFIKLSDTFNVSDNLIEAKHPIHLSITNVDYNQSKKKFEISFKMFTDDFQQIIFQKYAVKINLKNINDDKKSCEYINKYINEHFSLIINTQNIFLEDMKFKNSEIKDDNLWLYYEIKYNKQATNVEIRNSLMLDLYRDQKNLLIFTYKKTQKAFTFTEKNTKEKFKIN